MAGPAMALKAAVALASALADEEARRPVAAALWAVAIVAKMEILSEVSVMPPQAATVVMAVLAGIMMFVVVMHWLGLQLQR